MTTITKSTLRGISVPQDRAAYFYNQDPIGVDMLMADVDVLRYRMRRIIEHYGNGTAELIVAEIYAIAAEDAANDK